MVNSSQALLHKLASITSAPACDESLSADKRSVNGMAVIILQGDTSPYTLCI